MGYVSEGILKTQCFEIYVTLQNVTTPPFWVPQYMTQDHMREMTNCKPLSIFSQNGVKGHLGVITGQPLHISWVLGQWFFWASLKLTAALYLQEKLHFKHFYKMGSKVKLGSLEVNLYTPHMSLWSAVFLTEYELNRSMHMREKTNC